MIERVWRDGGTFQEWGEHFDLDRWLDAMAAEGLDPDWYVTRHRTAEEVLPWDHVTAGLHKDFLWADWQSALAEHGLPDCRWTPCYDCGVCTGYGIEHVVASPVAPAGGSQGTGQDLAVGPAAPSRCGSSRGPAHDGRGGAPVVRGDQGFPVRLRFAKHGKVRFISHRDVARAFERAFRIAELPLAFTQGFSPRPKVSFGLALSVGHESDAEYLDVELAEPVDLGAARGRAVRRAPRGHRRHRHGGARRAGAGPAGGDHRGRRTGSRSARRAAGGAETDGGRRLLARDTVTLTVVRKGRETVEDVRPALRRVEVVSADGRGPAAPRPRARHPAAHIRPGEALAALRDVSPDVGELVERRVVRTHQWIERDGARLEPLDADVRSSAPPGAATRALEACA